MEHLQHAFAIARHEQRRTREIDGLHVGRRLEVVCETDAYPVLAQHGIAFDKEVLPARVELVAEAGSPLKF